MAWQAGRVSGLQAGGMAVGSASITAKCSVQNLVSVVWSHPTCKHCGLVSTSKGEARALDHRVRSLSWFAEEKPGGGTGQEERTRAPSTIGQVRTVVPAPISFLQRFSQE